MKFWASRMGICFDYAGYQLWSEVRLSADKDEMLIKISRKRVFQQ
jgi:hypothetical protein